MRLFEFSDADFGYLRSPTRFVKAATAGDHRDRIRENRSHLDQVAVVSDDVPPTVAKARNVVITIERDGVRVQAASNGPAHLLLPVQFLPLPCGGQWCSGALTRANLLQTLVSFEGTLDTRLESRSGLPTMVAGDGLDNKALGL